MIIPSRRPAPYHDGPVTGILDDIAEYAAGEAHWSGTAGRLDSPVEHAGAVCELMPWSAKCRPGDARANRRERRPRGRLKKGRTQPSISADGPSRPSSRKTNPRKLWKAQIKSRRQTVAGQLTSKADGARRLRPEARPFEPACGVHPDDAAVPPQASPPRFSPLPAPPQAEPSSPTPSRTSSEDSASSLQADACPFVPVASGPPQASPPQLLLPRAAQSVSAPSRTPRGGGATTEAPPLPAQSSPSPPRAPRPAEQRNGQGTFLPAVSPPWPAANARGPSPVGMEKRTQPSSSADGPTSTPSRKADPGQLRTAKSKA